MECTCRLVEEDLLLLLFVLVFAFALALASLLLVVSPGQRGHTPGELVEVHHTVMVLVQKIHGLGHIICMDLFLKNTSQELPSDRCLHPSIHTNYFHTNTYVVMATN